MTHISRLEKGNTKRVKGESFWENKVPFGTRRGTNHEFHKQTNQQKLHHRMALVLNVEK